ncbi:MAG: hypothetical protein PVF49_12535 [Anaerolineales bacterium]|jgi:hypothetical protein
MTFSIERQQLEAWLQDILVPVEPSDHFIRRLKAKLVVYKGSGMPTTWILISAFLTMVFIGVAAIGLVVRLLLVWLSIINITQNRRQKSAPASQVT